MLPVPFYCLVDVVHSLMWSDSPYLGDHLLCASDSLVHMLSFSILSLSSTFLASQSGSSQWAEAFVSQGGVDHVKSVIMELELDQFKDSLPLKCLGLLIQLIK